MPLVRATFSTALPALVLKGELVACTQSCVRATPLAFPLGQGKARAHLGGIPLPSPFLTPALKGEVGAFLNLSVYMSLASPLGQGKTRADLGGISLPSPFLTPALKENSVPFLIYLFICRSRPL